MNSFTNMKALGAFVLLLLSNSSLADADHHANGVSVNNNGIKPVYADSHAPIGVMGDHMHHKGEWMLSYRYMNMSMQGNRSGTNELSPETIATTISNPFSGMPMQPPTLRVVPTKMTMEMHMVGGMYAPTDWLTLMVMSSYKHNSMDHITFQGPAGTTRLGTFTTKSSGMGDTKVSGLFRLYDDAIHHIHVNAGVSLPTGDTEETDDVLTPMNTRPTLRLPYPMQLGSGTYDLLPGLTYTGSREQFGWGAQYMGTIRTGSDNGYSLGDKHQLTGWFSYRWIDWLATSLRMTYMNQGEIDGRDPAIVAPVQTADPNNQGGDTVTLQLGMNIAGQTGWLRGHRLAVEAGIPVHQDLNGVQLETDLTVTAGWQYAF